MRRIALINQKGGVGKTTTVVNLGAALAESGRRVVVCDLDPQANLTLHLGQQLEQGTPSTYGVLMGQVGVAEALRPTSTPGLSLLGADIHLSGAELELANAFGRETLLRDALEEWRKAHREEHAEEPADYVLFDCPPSLGLLSINGLAAAGEIFIAVQTEFFALQGLSKLVEVVQLVQRRLHPALAITGIVPCLYDSRLRLAREGLGEIRSYFPEQVFRQSIGTNVKLAESPSFGQTILEYAPESHGARDYRALALEVLAQEPTSVDAPEPAAEPTAEEPAPAEVELTPAAPPGVAPSAAETPAVVAPEPGAAREATG